MTITGGPWFVVVPDAGAAGGNEDGTADPGDMGDAGDAENSDGADGAGDDSPDGLAPEDWPVPVDEATAMGGAHSTMSVVWLAAVSADELSGTPSDGPRLTAAIADLEALGYMPSATPLVCQDVAHESLGVARDLEGDYAWGVGLFFTSRADADRWVELSGRTVRGVVDGPVFCHFS